MSDLISRSALIKKLESMSSDNDVRNNSHQFTYKELAYIICNQPTAYDIEEVVEEIRKQPHGDYGVQEENEIIDIVRRVV